MKRVPAAEVWQLIRAQARRARRLIKNGATLACRVCGDTAAREITHDGRVLCNLHAMGEKHVGTI